MGNEFLVLFVPVPVMFMIWNLWSVIVRKNRMKHGILLVFGMAWMSYMVSPVTTGQYFIQGLAVGGFLYSPLYFFAWLILTVVMRPHGRAANASEQ